MKYIFSTFAAISAALLFLGCTEAFKNGSDERSHLGNSYSTSDVSFLTLEIRDLEPKCYRIDETRNYENALSGAAETVHLSFSQAPDTSCDGSAMKVKVPSFNITSAGTSRRTPYSYRLPFEWMEPSITYGTCSLRVILLNGASAIVDICENKIVTNSVQTKFINKNTKLRQETLEISAVYTTERDKKVADLASNATKEYNIGLGQEIKRTLKPVSLEKDKEIWIKALKKAEEDSQ